LKSGFESYSAKGGRYSGERSGQGGGYTGGAGSGHSGGGAVSGSDFAVSGCDGGGSGGRWKRHEGPSSERRGGYGGRGGVRSSGRSGKGIAHKAPAGVLPPLSGPPYWVGTCWCFCLPTWLIVLPFLSCTSSMNFKSASHVTQPYHHSHSLHCAWRSPHTPTHTHTPTPTPTHSPTPLLFPFCLPAVPLVSPHQSATTCHRTFCAPPPQVF
jgi:hypothetical protein